MGQGLHGAVRAIVRDALSQGVGRTLPTNVTYHEMMGLGAGTLQRALDVLRDRGALEVTSRGHLGRVIDSIDVGQCWQAAGLETVKLLLPPSGPIEIEVLDNRLAVELSRLGIPHTVQHLRGGALRFESVCRGDHDLVVVSSGTFDSLLERLGEEKGMEGAAADGVTVGGAATGGMVAGVVVTGGVVTGLARGGGADRKAGGADGADDQRLSLATRRLEPGTYYGPGRLVVVSRTDSLPVRPLRVAIDRDSPDHVALTLGEFGDGPDIEFIDVPFPSVPASVLRNRVDVGVWHTTRSVIPLDLAGLTTRPITSEARDAVAGAVLAASPGRPEMRSVLAELDFTDLAAEQRRAIEAAADEE